MSTILIWFIISTHVMVVFSELPSANFDACLNKVDLNCIGKISTLFISHLAKGFVPLGIDPMDPLYMDSVATNEVDGMTVYYNNFTMTGFKTVDINILKFKFRNVSVEEMTFDYDATSKILFKSSSNKDKQFDGTYHSKGKVTLVVYIRFDTKTKVFVEFFDIKPAEGTECEIQDGAVFELNPELVTTLDEEKDDELQEYLKKRRQKEIEVYKGEICTVLKEAVAIVLVPGIGKGTQFVPVSAFFKPDFEDGDGLSGNIPASVPGLG